MHKRLNRWVALSLPSLLFIGGCGVGQLSGVSANGGAFSISASSSAINSNGQVQFTALLPSGEPAQVTWSIAGGENASSLGEGHIDAAGLYRPPGALSRDQVQIRIQAQLVDNPAETATASVTVTPGFVQPLLPQNAALTAGATLEVSAEIAEVNAGTVQWSLSNSPAGDGNGNAANAGTLGNLSCQRSLDQYTTCKVSYTAPPVLAGASTVYLTGIVNGQQAAGGGQTAGGTQANSSTRTTAPLKILLNKDGVNSSPSTNQGAQSGLIAMGGSGGNDNDYDTYEDRSGNPYIADCCGGTLGALVEDAAKNEYILSNNHVLAESDQAKIGDTIDAPGLIDNGCVPLTHAGSTLRPVGTLKYFVPLGSPQSNVDAALATAAPGAVDPSGSILQLDAPGTGANDTLGATPPMGGQGETLNAGNLGSMELVKSGRTTGLTCSTVETVALTVKVNYFRDCAETQPYYTKVFHNQIGIAGKRYTDSGDSGSLVVDASNAAPVGLFYAGGNNDDGGGLSLANPIGDVLHELGGQAGSQLSIVGTATPHKVACVRYDANSSGGDPDAPSPDRVPVAPDATARAQLAAETVGAALVNPEAGIIGTAAGKSLDSPGEATIIFYTDNTKPYVSVPQTLSGLRTQVIPTDAGALARDAEPTTPSSSSGIHLSANVLAGATAVVREYAARIVSDPAIIGVGVAQSLDNPSDPALLVLVDMNSTPKSMPATIGGLRVRYMRLHRFHVTQSKYSGANHASSCALKGLTSTREPRPSEPELSFPEN